MTVWMYLLLVLTLDLVLDSGKHWITVMSILNL